MPTVESVQVIPRSEVKGSEYHGFAKDQAPKHQSPDDLRLKFEAKQKELEARRRAWEERKKAEAASAAAAVELVAKSNNYGIWRWSAAVFAVMALGILCVQGWRAGRQLRTPPLLPLQSLTPAAPRAPSVADAHSTASPAATPGALSTAMDRLDSAISDLPGLSPEEVLRRASASDRSCDISWKDNLPSVVFGRQPLRPNSIAKTLSSCADAVERLH